jgi:two-component system, OmpR family, phosphate regulon sensor histidine kinase PhoR
MLRSASALAAATAVLAAAWAGLPWGGLLALAAIPAVWIALRQEASRTQRSEWGLLQRSLPPSLFLEASDMRQLCQAIGRQWVEHERAQSVLSAIREGVLAVDAEGFLILSNSSAQQILSWDSSMVGSRIEDLHFPKTVGRVLGKAMEGRVSERLWKRGQKPERNYYEVHGIPWSSGSGCVLVLRDITRLRRLERVRRDFVANISHELRTPIAIVRANAETLVNGAMNDEVYGPRFLSAILRNGERLSRLIDELLELSRLEAGQYTLAMRIQPLLPVVSSVLDSLRPQAESKGQHIGLSIPPGLHAAFDEKAFEHIVSNYIENAIKYTPEGGRISVFSEEGLDRVLFKVADNGSGIPAKYRSRIFERFFRVDKGRSRSEGGTGLGLSIVRHFAEAMQAKVGMEPAEDSGSVFWCSMPLSLDEPEDD